MPDKSLNLKLICCSVFFRETCAIIANSPHRVDMEYLPKGLHDLPSADMRQRLQEKVDSVDASEYDAILMGYGLCNNGLHHLATKHIPLVIPRAHDCMTLFMGSRQRYLEYFNKNPGTYFQTSGWIERGEVSGELRQRSIPNQLGMEMPYEEMVEKYGEDNADYLVETLGQTEQHYGQITFIEMGVEPDNRFEEAAKNRACDQCWNFEKIQGDMTLLTRLINGPWDEEDFLTLQPGQRINACYDEGIVRAETILAEKSTF